MSNQTERKGKRGHENGNVRPADGRYDLHESKDESKVVRTPQDAAETQPARKAKR